MHQLTNTLQRQDFLYHPFYCEENIWHLCQHDRFKDSHVVFIASKGDAFPMLCQRAMPDPATPVLWDYHVVLLLSGDKTQIIDFDTTLPFCSDIDEYLRHSFLDNQWLPSEYVPFFRVLSAEEYSQSFYSDRSHMKTDTGWNSPPPNWPVIGDGGTNLSQFTNMNDPTFGEILSGHQSLKRYFSSNRKGITRVIV